MSPQESKSYMSRLLGHSITFKNHETYRSLWGSRTNPTTLHKTDCNISSSWLTQCHFAARRTSTSSFKAAHENPRIEHRSIKEEANNATPFQKDEGCKTPEKDPKKKKNKEYKRIFSVDDVRSNLAREEYRDRLRNDYYYWSRQHHGQRGYEQHHHGGRRLKMSPSNNNSGFQF